jgi:hypothetical protein
MRCDATCLPERAKHGDDEDLQAAFFKMEIAGSADETKKPIFLTTITGLDSNDLSILAIM